MTRFMTLYALSIVASLCPMDPALAAASGIKCGNGNVNVSVSGGHCSNYTTQVVCTNSKGDSAVGSCSTGGVASCGDSSGSGSCVISRRVIRGKPGVPSGGLRQ
jgi:hypothetical protein